jgi:hypothetical protein
MLWRPSFKSLCICEHAVAQTRNDFTYFSPYSRTILDLLMTFRYFNISARRKSAKAIGPVTMSSAPSCASGAFRDKNHCGYQCEILKAEAARLRAA